MEGRGIREREGAMKDEDEMSIKNQKHDHAKPRIVKIWRDQTGEYRHILLKWKDPEVAPCCGTIPGGWFNKAETTDITLVKKWEARYLITREAGEFQ